MFSPCPRPPPPFSAPPPHPFQCPSVVSAAQAAGAGVCGVLPHGPHAVGHAGRATANTPTLFGRRQVGSQLTYTTKFPPHFFCMDEPNKVEGVINVTHPPPPPLRGRVVQDPASLWTARPFLGPDPHFPPLSRGNMRFSDIRVMMHGDTAEKNRAGGAQPGGPEPAQTPPSPMPQIYIDGPLAF